MTIHNAYDELAGILSVVDPVRLLNLQASVETQQRFERLINASKGRPLSKFEKDELNHCIVLERLIRLAKIKARTHKK